MATQDKTDPNELLKGQLWRMEGQYLLVSDVGKKLVHYQMLRKPEQRVAAMNIANRMEVANFLVNRKATLVSRNTGSQGASAKVPA
jgi:hypothetical protein